MPKANIKPSAEVIDVATFFRLKRKQEARKRGAHFQMGASWDEYTYWVVIVRMDSSEDGGPPYYLFSAYAPAIYFDTVHAREENEVIELAKNELKKAIKRLLLDNVWPPCDISEDKLPRKDEFHEITEITVQI